MANPVWVLSVDLQTKTATFQSGMSDAAKTARGAFNDIKQGSDEMSGHVGMGMFASRHAVMAVSEAFGTQMPRAITALLVHIGPLGAALEAAFPFAAIALGAVLLIEHLSKLEAEGIKLTEDQVKFGTAVQNTFNQLDQKLIQAAIRSDELRNDHLGALHHQLELIDKQSMEQLIHSFGEVAKAADVVFADLKTGWYQMGAGSAGAKHALEDFQVKYDALLTSGKDKEASDLLAGTKKSAEEVLRLQTAAAAATKGDKATGADFGAEVAKEQAVVDLRKQKIGYSEKEVQAQQILVDALGKQAEIEARMSALKKLDSSNATTATGKELASIKAQGDKEAAEHAQRMGQLGLEAERAQSEAGMSMKQATVIERLALDVHLANEEYRVEMDGNAARIAALDKSGRDYNNQLRALQDKTEELTAQHATTLAKLGAKAQQEQFQRDIAAMEAHEREAIEATDQGSAERLMAIDAALKEEESKNLQETERYRNLLKERVQVVRQMTTEENKLRAEAGKEEAESTQKMGELALAAARDKQALLDSARRVTIQQRMAEELQANQAEFALKQAALAQEAAALDKSGKDYENKLKAIQDKEKQLVQQHENDITRIKSQAEMERNAKILSAEQHFNDTVAAGLSQVLMGHQTFASMMNSLGNQVVSGMMENAIKSIMANDMTKESDASAAARKAFNSGMKFPFPVNLVMAPVLGAAAFSSVMAFQEGTDMVPGIGTGDKVPAMLEPGEGVVPGGVMDNLRKMASSGDMSGGNHYHAHVAPVYNLQALDATGMDKILKNHAPTLAKHVNNELRKMNH